MNYKLFKISLAVLSIIFFQFSANAQLADKIELTEDNQLLGLGTQYILKSEILQEDRPIIISLPIGYENNKNVFYLGIWLREKLSEMSRNQASYDLRVHTIPFPEDLEPAILKIENKTLVSEDLKVIEKFEVEHKSEVSGTKKIQCTKKMKEMEVSKLSFGPKIQMDPKKRMGPKSRIFALGDDSYIY